MWIALVLMTAAPLQVLCKGLVCSPTNVSCIGKIHLKNSQLFPRVYCKWDRDQYTTDIKYTVHLKYRNEEHICESWGNNCTFPEHVNGLLNERLSILVVAENSYGSSARSDELTYNEVWNIVQMDSPAHVIAEPLPSGLRVSWAIEWYNMFNIEYEIRLHEEGSHESFVKSLKNYPVTTAEITEVKPCTDYTVSVRCRYYVSIWSTWSRPLTVTSYCNVSSLPFHLWRSKSISRDGGHREVHLMWKGVPPPCKVFDEYCILYDSQRIPMCFGPDQDHAFVTLDEHPRRITVAVFRNKTSLNEASVEVPAREVSLPPVENVSVVVQHGRVYITWDKPSLPVSGYIIVWNSTAKNHMWQQTLETSFTLKGEPKTPYTISLTPLYKDGPGNEITLHNCNQEGDVKFKVEVRRVSDRHAEIHWLPVLPTHCCLFVLNYTVFYKTNNESKARSVTVGPNEHHVTLRDLQAGTLYSVYIMASTLTTFSKSGPITFLTSPNSNLFLVMIIIFCSGGLILLSIIVLIIQKKYVSKKIPDPRFSSLSMWPSENCRKVWRLVPMPGSKDTEKILPCHVDSDVISVSPTSEKDMVIEKALAGIQNNATHKPTSQIENTALADGFSNKDPLPFDATEQKVPLVLSLEMQSSETCPLPTIQSPYRKQTPINSPVESLSKPAWLDETETLLIPKHKNTNYISSYVTLDMVESKKHPNV